METQANMANVMTFPQKINAFIKNSPARMAVIIAVLLYAVTVIAVPTALNMAAISTIVMVTILLSIASAGQTIVLIGGGLDMSVGAVMSMAAIITTAMMNNQDGMEIPVFFTVVAMGATVGLINGVCTTKIGLPALIVTLVISNVVTRLQYVFTQGSPSGFAGPQFVNSITGRFFGVIPSLVVYAIVLFPIVFYLLNRSRFGKQLYLVGNNAEAARLSGINVNKIKILSYVFSGMFAGFAGMLGAGYARIAQCQMYDGYAFESLIAVIIGGTTLTGGKGSYTGTIAGALLMTVLSNMLTTVTMTLPTNVAQPIRNIVLGGVLILLLTMYNRKKAVRQ